MGLPTSTPPAFQMAALDRRPDIPYDAPYYARARGSDIHFPRPGTCRCYVETRQAVYVKLPRL